MNNTDNINKLDFVDKKIKYNNLFDFYGCLLTLKQQQYFTSYHFDDLTLSEVASTYNISRNAVYDQLNKIYTLLDYYEANLNLATKFKNLEEVINKYKDSKNEDVKNIIKELRNME